jgi:hypothetical protein
MCGGWTNRFDFTEPGGRRAQVVPTPVPRLGPVVGVAILSTRPRSRNGEVHSRGANADSRQ